MNAMTQIDDPILTALRAEREALLEKIAVADAARDRLRLIDEMMLVLGHCTEPKPVVVEPVAKKRRGPQAEASHPVLAAIKGGANRYTDIVAKASLSGMPVGTINVHLGRMRRRGILSNPARGVWTLPGAAA